MLFKPKTKFFIQVVLFIGLHIAISIVLSIVIINLINMDTKKTQINLSLDKISNIYKTFNEDKTVFGLTALFFGDTADYSGELYVFNNSRREIMGKEPSFDLDNIFGISGNFSDNQHSYYFKYYKDIRLYLVLQIPKTFMNHVNPNVIWGVVALNFLLLFVFYIFFLFLKNLYYNPVITFEKSLEEIIEDGYNPRVNYDYMIKTHPLSNRFEKLIMNLRELIEREYNETLLRKQAELNALQEQINPHFLYNTLDTIRGQAMWEGMDSIAKMTQALGPLLKIQHQHEKRHGYSLGRAG